MEMEGESRGKTERVGVLGGGAISQFGQTWQTGI